MHLTSKQSASKDRDYSIGKTKSHNVTDTQLCNYALVKTRLHMLLTPNSDRPEDNQHFSLKPNIALRISPMFDW